MKSKLVCKFCCKWWLDPIFPSHKKMNIEICFFIFFFLPTISKKMKVGFCLFFLFLHPIGKNMNVGFSLFLFLHAIGKKMNIGFCLWFFFLLVIGKRMNIGFCFFFFFLFFLQLTTLNMLLLTPCVNCRYFSYIVNHHGSLIKLFSHQINHIV